MATRALALQDLRLAMANEGADFRGGQWDGLLLASNPWRRARGGLCPLSLRRASLPFGLALRRERQVPVGHRHRRWWNRLGGCLGFAHGPQGPRHRGCRHSQGGFVCVKKGEYFYALRAITGRVDHPFRTRPEDQKGGRGVLGDRLGCLRHIDPGLRTLGRHRSLSSGSHGPPKPIPVARKSPWCRPPLKLR